MTIQHCNDMCDQIVEKITDIRSLISDTALMYGQQPSTDSTLKTVLEQFDVQLQSVEHMRTVIVILDEIKSQNVIAVISLKLEQMFASICNYETALTAFIQDAVQVEAEMIAQHSPTSIQ